MSKKNSATEPSGTAGMTTIVVADATAAGEETLTSVTATVYAADLEKKTVVKGQVTAIAVARPGEGETAFTDAATDVSITGADKVVMKTKITSGSDGDISITKFKAIDKDKDEGEQTIIYKIKEKTVDDIGIDPAGNVATVSFDAQASGDDTLVEVDAFALAVEDELSLSTVMIVTAIG